MYCSLMTGPREYFRNEFDATDLGEAAGLKFIYLNHKMGFSETSINMWGFQGAQIFKTRTGVEYQLDKNPKTGKDSASGRQLKFRPVGKLKKLTCAIPDTKFNREVLSSCYYRGKSKQAGSGGCWNIVDKDIEKEIARVAKEKYPPRVTKRLSLTETNAAEVRMLKEQLKEKIKETDIAREASLAQLTTSQKDKLRTICVERVFSEYKELVNEIKEEGGPKFQLTKRYLKEINPLIAKEMDKLIAERANK